MTIPPPYPQDHPAMATARSIVDQLLDQTPLGVSERQALNDAADQTVARLVEAYAVERAGSMHAAMNMAYRRGVNDALAARREGS